MPDTSPLLKIACHRTLTILNKGEGARGAVFNKVLTLLSKRLLDSKFDIDLPHCWYLYGDEVVPRELPPQVHFNPSNEQVHRTIVTWEGNPPDETSIPEWKLKRIGDGLSLIIKEFGDPISLPDIIDEVYEGAPFDFQKDFLAWRRRLDDIASVMRFERPVEGILRPTFETAVSRFHKNEFQQIAGLERRFIRLTRYAFEHGGVQYLKPLSNEFWQAFCYYLRIHPRGFRKVSQSRLDHWTRIANDHLISIGPKITAMAEEMVEDLNGGRTIDPLEHASIVGSHWGKDTARASVEVDSFAYR
jgi:hypothetical protein